MNDTFEPIEIPSNVRAASADLRYRVEDTKYGLRLRVFIPARLYKGVRPEPKGWRLDANRAKGRGRVSALIQMTAGAKKHVSRDDDKSIGLSYPYAGGLPEVFPNPGNTSIVVLEGAVVTSMGIEFDLPAVKAVKATAGEASGDQQARPKVRTWPKKA